MGTPCNLSFDHIRIRQMREYRLLSQGQVAKSLGISQSSYNDLEQGRTKLRAEALPSLAQILKVDIRCFFETHLIYQDQITILEEKENLIREVHYLQSKNESLNKLLDDNKLAFVSYQIKCDKLIENLEKLVMTKKIIIHGLTASVGVLFLYFLFNVFV